ncbi:GIY-YIG nuclease family protein [Candidatus Falkowbacteria bacterium]|jgi:putative endonuclease|nr:GIY-YIG nuclease family protein [Candidatus Falkowbacteria bacterium]MBT5503146.1 GIY-YIG nuclease family protein [Candidatus Falkowbacteria bacterium]MBT6574534.1 GIY-YIG nuclease family protein [Candidatus Falkowbacteria bacterium]MBT7348311.1 GIY-YIG nuclease family protein [Candidatus Falkowbacteria bacterium]MBT7500889.1 GIY-YIG nuclease family protein [Candidatus Falkowbacteria bacterium]
MNQKHYYVYILANKYNSVLYVGMTSDLRNRMYQHKEKVYPRSFSARYNINKLMYYEVFEDPWSAICREKQLKAGSSLKKRALIEQENNAYEDLSMEWF